MVLFTDTLGDVNGVSRFIRNVAEQATETGRSLTVLTSTNFTVPSKANLINVRPIFATKMPRYENLELVVPPVIKMLQIAHDLRPDVIHISTPGSVGLVGLLAAKRLGLPIVGVYHTDFPAYIEKLFDDHALTAGCARYMKWFYKHFASVFTRSDEYAPALQAIKVPMSRVNTLQAGIVLEQFHPRFRDCDVYPRVLGEGAGPADQMKPLRNTTSTTHAHRALPIVVRALYCGRVSTEKGLPLLSRVWLRASEHLQHQGVLAQLIVIGDGPYRAEMETRLHGHHAHFLGFRYASELSALYASADFFVFPSTTDTLGQVVMESQASGLPVIVTDVGGPKEVTRDGATGFVVPAQDDDAWVRHIVQLATDDALRVRMGTNAHAFMQQFSMQASFEHYWRVHESVWLASRDGANVGM